MGKRAYRGKGENREHSSEILYSAGLNILKNSALKSNFSLNSGPMALVDLFFNNFFNLLPTLYKIKSNV
jgi:hypothetical protein